MVVIWIPDTPIQAYRLREDPRLDKECDACGHPGFMHVDAENQYEIDGWGVPVYEAGDITCEAEQDTGGYIGGCSCEWYESDNWRKDNRVGDGALEAPHK